MPSSHPSTYVVTFDDRPLAAADSLDAAQDNALARQTQWARAEEYDYRWDEYAPGVWRLMQRRKGEAGKGRRFSWTCYAVHTVEFLGGAV